MKKLAFILTLVMIVLFSLLALYHPKDSKVSERQSSALKIKKELDKRYRDAIKRQNKNLPKMLDEVTRLDSVHYFDMEVTYIYTILSQDADKFDSKHIKEKSRPLLKEQVCAKMEAMWKYGVSVGHIYHDQQGTRIYSAVIRPDECEI